jgi:two-component system, NtrC family, response regulator HydG
MANILLVEDDKTFVQILQGFLIKKGFEVDAINCIKDALSSIDKKEYQLILLDYRLPDGIGLDLIKLLRSKNNKTPIIVITSFLDIRTAVNAVKMGAFDYITKPIMPDELLMIIQQAISKKEITQLNTLPIYNRFIEGESEKSVQLNEYVKLVAPTEVSVIIQGESGTGKEHVARSIHALSKRSEAPFVAIDCGTLSSELAASELFGHSKGSFTGAMQDKKGQFEMANKGTFFLDEVGNLSYEVQVKLLRTLQEKVIQPVGSTHTVKIDIRIIAATNEDLLVKVKNGSFREDLYHRLNEFKILVPALRQRKDDLAQFVQHFISLSNVELGKNVKTVSTEVMQIFKQYEWPGNLRELKNIIKRAVLLSKGNIIEKEVLPEEMILESLDNHPVQSEFDLKALQETNEREMIIKTLQEVKYNKSKAARLLNIDRKTLYMKMAKYNIND